MDPLTPLQLIFGGSTFGFLVLMGKITYNYGKDRKALNGTVDRVKTIEHTLSAHIEDEQRQDMAIRQDIARLETKVDLLINHKIRGQ